MAGPGKGSLEAGIAGNEFAVLSEAQQCLTIASRCKRPFISLMKKWSWEDQQDVLHRNSFADPVPGCDMFYCQLLVGSV